MRKAAAILLAVAFCLGVRSTGVGRANDCATIGTERQKSLSDGWTTIAHASLAEMGYGYLTVDGRQISTTDLAQMSDDERKVLADRWVANQDGTAELAAYREALATCEGTTAATTSATNATADRECGEYAATALDQWGQWGMTAEDVETFSGCRRDAASGWFWPTGPDDSRLPGGPILNDDEREATVALAAALGNQIAGFEAVLSGAANPFRGGGSLLDALEARYYDPQVHGGIGHNRQQQYGDDAAAWAEYRNRLDPFLRDPNHVALNVYVGWFGERRAAIIERVSQNLNPYARPALAGTVARQPWPWNLRDEIELAYFLDWALANGLAQPAEPEPSATTAAGDCTALANWLGGTRARMVSVQRLLPDAPLPFEPDADDAGAYRDYAYSLQQLVADQEASDPPAEARAVHALLIRAWTGFGDAYLALADAAEAGDQAAYDRAVGAFIEPRDDAQAAFEEIKRLQEGCGLPVEKVATDRW